MLSTSICHEKEDLPLCTYCQKSFANISNLRHHIQIIHFKENKWDCHQCGKICSSKSNLKVHFRTHNRMKPYTCKHCHYDCKHHSSIKDHLLKHHPDKPHTTIEPGYTYKSLDFDRKQFIQSIDHSQMELKYLQAQFNLLLPFLPFWSYPPSSLFLHEKPFNNHEIFLDQVKPQRSSPNKDTY